jgi:hypothetical protein
VRHITSHCSCLTVTVSLSHSLSHFYITLLKSHCHCFTLSLSPPFVPHIAHVSLSLFHSLTLSPICTSHCAHFSLSLFHSVTLSPIRATNTHRFLSCLTPIVSRCRDCPCRSSRCASSYRQLLPLCCRVGKGRDISTPLILCANFLLTR